MKQLLLIMTSPRCKKFLLLELERLRSRYTNAELEMNDLSAVGSDEKYAMLSKALHNSNDNVANHNRSLLLDRLKLAIIEAIDSDQMPGTNFSVYLSNKLNYNYTYLSNQFSLEHSYSLKRYIIVQKIERAKELLLMDRFTLSEIAWKLQYSSVAHLSNQFKKIAGTSPSFFRMMERKKLTARPSPLPLLLELSEL